MLQRAALPNLQGSVDLHRLVIAVQQEHGQASSRLVLRQETYADDVGWFVQSCVAIEPEQVAGLKMALSTQPTAFGKPDRGGSSVPAILSFDGAVASSAG